jgi:ketosteroid isomerase-like protein
VPNATPPTVEDRIAINDLIASYAWALDTGDVDAPLACFTPDAVVIEEVFDTRLTLAGLIHGENSMCSRDATDSLRQPCTQDLRGRVRVVVVQDCVP